MKKIIYFFIILFILLIGSNVLASDKLDLYFFYGDGCPHCAKERKYLETIKAKYPKIKINAFEIYHNADNIELMQQVAKKLKIDVAGVPFLVIGDKHFVGFAEGLTSSQIEARIKDCLNKKCSDSIAALMPDSKEEITAQKETSEQKEEIKNSEDKKEIDLPLVGKINLNKFSLPVLTIIMGILDGFNPCAMWALLFLISLLLGMKNKKRMWILGSAFIISSAAVYFIFMSAWLNLILFLGFIIWVRIIIASLALLGGGYSIREFFINKEAGCKVSDDKRRLKTFEKLKNIVGQNSFWLALGGIIALAFMVNLVELICSAGLPAVYTQVLALNYLKGWQYYGYILLYVFFFMLDDLFIFFAAMITLQMTGLTTKYARYSRLIGGIIMLIIGLLLIFRPEWLSFG